MILLRRTISVVTCSAAIAAACGVSILFNEHAKEISVRSTLKGMESEAELLAYHYKVRHDQLSADVALIAQERSIRDLFEIQTQPAIPPVPETGKDQLQDYVADMFQALLGTRPEYTQVRLIGVANGGKEIIRVHKNTDGEIVRTPDIALQDKSAEPYFQEVVNHDWAATGALQDRLSHALFSRVTFNRENGRISYPLSYMLRAMYPVLDDTKTPLGFVVINVDYAQLLNHAFSGLSQGANVIVMNDQGDYLSYIDGSKITRLEVAGEYTNAPSAMIRALLDSSEPSGVYEDDEAIAYYRATSINRAQPERKIKIAYVQPRSQILASIGGIGWQIALSAALIVTLAVVVVIVLISAIMRPLKILKAEVVRASDGETALNLPVQWDNELGQLARAFQSLVDRHAEAETRLRLIIDNLGEGIVTIDDAGTIVSFNPACERIFQYAADEVIGKNINVLMPLKQARHHDRYLARYLEDGVHRIDWSGRIETGKRADGTAFPMELTVTELSFGTRRLFAGILRDISGRMQAEQEKSEFLANISHELRTPLTAIKGALGLMRTPAVRDCPEKADQITALAIRNCERLQDLTEDLMDLERFEDQKFRLNKELLDLATMVDELGPLLQDLREGYGVDFDIARESAHAKVLGDRAQLRRVLANLLSDAAKSSRPGNRVVIRISEDRRGKVARLSVAGNGNGLPEHARGGNAAGFTPAARPGADRSGGAGIRLAISKEIISLHGGALQRQPLEGGGSVFSFELPLANRATVGAMQRPL